IARPPSLRQSQLSRHTSLRDTAPLRRSVPAAICGADSRLLCPAPRSNPMPKSHSTATFAVSSLDPLPPPKAQAASLAPRRPQIATNQNFVPLHASPIDREPHGSAADQIPDSAHSSRLKRLLNIQ